MTVVPPEVMDARTKQTKVCPKCKTMYFRKRYMTDVDWAFRVYCSGKCSQKSNNLDLGGSRTMIK